MPRCDLCQPCLEGKAQKGAGMKGPSAPKQDLEIGFDIIGPLVESPDGNVYKLVGCETTSGVGWGMGLPNRTSKAALQGIQAALAFLRSCFRLGGISDQPCPGTAFISGYSQQCAKNVPSLAHSLL